MSKLVNKERSEYRVRAIIDLAHASRNRGRTEMQLSNRQSCLQTLSRFRLRGRCCALNGLQRIALGMAEGRYQIVNLIGCHLTDLRDEKRGIDVPKIGKCEGKTHLA